MMMKAKSTRYVVFGLLFGAFLSISIYALLNAGDESLAPDAIGWLKRRPSETASTLRGAELAASLTWRTHAQKPAGEEMVAELKLADRLEGQERLDAIDAIAKKYVRTEVGQPQSCHLNYFCEGSDREAALRELEVIRPTLALYREMIKQEGLSYDAAAAPGAPDLTNKGLLNLHRFDLIDLSLNVDKNASVVVSQLVERAAFWKRVAGEDSLLVRKLIALSNLNSISTFAREWVIRDLERGGSFAAKAALLSKIQELRTEVSPQASRKMLESTYSREFQMVAEIFEVAKTNRGEKKLDALIDTGESADAQEFTRALGHRSMMSGFQPNRTLNTLQRVFEEATEPACLSKDGSSECLELMKSAVGRGLFARLQNPAGRKLLSFLSQKAMQSSHRAHQALVDYNGALDRLAEALEQPGAEALKRLKSAAVETQNAAHAVALSR